MKTQDITIPALVELLCQNPKAVDRAMVVLYNRQTREEQEAEPTLARNGRGFNAFDAKPGTYYAKWVLSGKSLSGRHLEKARKLALKYVAQLQEEAQLKARNKAE